MYDVSQDNLTIATTCYTCIQSDSKCVECQEELEARDTSRAYELVDEGNVQYRKQWMIERPQPSGHDWTDRDGEFLPPIVHLEDGGVLDNTWELNDYVQRSREVVCPWCQLLTPKQFNDCQDCDRPLESNVR